MQEVGIAIRTNRNIAHTHKPVSYTSYKGNVTGLPAFADQQ